MKCKHCAQDIEAGADGKYALIAAPPPADPAAPPAPIPPVVVAPPEDPPAPSPKRSHPLNRPLFAGKPKPPSTPPAPAAP